MLPDELSSGGIIPRGNRSWQTQRTSTIVGSRKPVDFRWERLRTCFFILSRGQVALLAQAEELAAGKAVLEAGRRDMEVRVEALMGKEWGMVKVR